MNELRGILSDAFTLLIVWIATAVANTVNGRPPAWVNRWAQNASRGGQIAAGIAMWWMLFSGLLIVGGIKFESPVTVYVGFSFAAAFAMFTKVFVSLCEQLAKIFWSTLVPASIMRRFRPTIEFAVQESLADISIFMLMSSVIALDGQAIGLTLNAIGWFSLASLIALMIMSGAQVKMRRKVMGGFAGLFVILYVVFHLMPGIREDAFAAAENLQVGQRSVADVIRPAMPLDEVRLHQETAARVLKSELARYTEKVSNLERAAANHTPTPNEVEEFQKAMENVTTLRQALKLRNSQATQEAGNYWNVFYVGIGVLVLLGVFRLVIWQIVKSIPKGGEQQNTTNGATAATGASSNSAADHGSDSHGGHGSSSKFSWPTFAVGVVILAVIATIAFYYRQTPAQASSLPDPAPASAKPFVPVVVPPQLVQKPDDAQEFKVVSVSENGGEFQLDARVVWQLLPLTVSHGDILSWSAKGKTCVAEPTGYSCHDPDGYHPSGVIPWAENSNYKPEQYALGHAFTSELLLQVGDKKFAAGNISTYVVPDGIEQVKIWAMPNVRTDEAILARGGPKVTFNITRNK